MSSSTWLVVERTAIAVHLFPLGIVGRFFTSADYRAACGFVLRGARTVRPADESDGWDICGRCARAKAAADNPPPIERGYGYELGPITAEDRRIRLDRRNGWSGRYLVTVRVAFSASSIEDARTFADRILPRWLPGFMEYEFPGSDPLATVELRSDAT